MDSTLLQMFQQQLLASRNKTANKRVQIDSLQPLLGILLAYSYKIHFHPPSCEDIKG